jgi:hypothetical protein
MTQLRRFKLMFFSAVLLVLLISGCLPSGPTQVVEQPEAPQVDVRVIPSGEPLVRVVQSEKIVQPNCGGTLEVENVVERSRTIIHTVELEGSVEVNAQGEVGLLGTGVKVGAAIAAQYGQSYGTEDTLTRAITVKAKEGTNMEHTIQQVEIWQLGTVEITIGDQQFTYPYHFRNDFGVELVTSQNIGCPPSEGVPSTPTTTPTTPPTEFVPILTPTLTPGKTMVPTLLPEPTRIVPFSARITIELRQDIDTWGDRFYLNFDVKNESHEQFVLRFDQSDVQLVDDQGKEYWVHDSEGHQMFTVDAGGERSFQILFDGPIDPAANRLTVTIKQISGVSNVVWELNLKQPSAGVTIELRQDIDIWGDRFYLNFDVKNESREQFVLRFNQSDVQLVDDQGKEYWVHDSEGHQMFTVDAGGERSFQILFDGPIGSAATKLIVNISVLSGVGNLSWELSL